MGQLKITELKPVQISVEPKTNLLVLRQGNSEVKITRDHVANMKRLRDGTFPCECFTSNLIPRNRFTIDDNGTITITCKDEWEDNEVILANHKKLDDLERIQDFVNKHKRILKIDAKIFTFSFLFYKYFVYICTRWGNNHMLGSMPNGITLGT